VAERKKVRITVSGYYGFGNTGDEAILMSLLQILRRTPKAEVTVLSAYPKRTFKEHGVKSVSRINPLSVIASILNCDILISGGGGLLQDATSSRSLLYYLGVIFLGCLFRKRVVLLAQSIGPISKKINRRLTAWVLNKVGLITVRDELSLEELKRLGVNRVPIAQTADLTLLLEKIPEDEEENLFSSINIKQPFIVFCLRNLKHRKIQAEDFGAIAQKLTQGFGTEVIFLPFQASFDRRLSEELSGITPNSKVCPQLRPREIISLFSRADLVVGMRLHSLIFAAKARTPFLPLSYDPKVNAFVLLLGQESLSVDDPAEKIFSKIELILKNRVKIKQSLEERVSELEKKAEENWIYLRDLINHIS